jgi:hypothetical protein
MVCWAIRLRLASSNKTIKTPFLNIVLGFRIKITTYQVNYYSDTGICRPVSGLESTKFKGYFLGGTGPNVQV